MIPRYQRIIFWSLIAGIALMSAFLIHGCQAARKRLSAFNDTIPLAAPATAATEDVTLYLASDADASITPTTQSLALPQDPTLRARTILNGLFAAYAAPASTHPLPGGPAIDDIFLLAPPASKPAAHAEPPPDASVNPATLAIINLHGAFVDSHPSGVLVEALTVQSIIGTLHAALPDVTQIRFVVDGQPHDTLAGHADLLRTYPAEDTTAKPIPLIEN